MLGLIENLDTSKIVLYTERLQDGTLTYKAYHNKKYYAKTSNNLTDLLELTLAWELHKINSKGS